MSRQFTPSPQQKAFIDWAHTGTGSCVLEAVAGAGKTTTLLAAARKIKGDVAILAYNKKIAEEIKAKTTRDHHITPGTVHSFGNRAYKNSLGNVVLERKKTEIMFATMVKDYFYSSMVLKLVSLAKQKALGVVGDINNHSEWQAIASHFDVFVTKDKDLPWETQQEIINYAIRLLKASTAEKNIIDFDDMIYMPLVHNARFPKYDVVMLDEAQDTNPARREMVKRMLKPDGRLIAVGDRHQAIYGFTGADNDSLELIKRDFNAIELPMTVTYRCPKSVVAFAQQWVSHIHAHDDAPEGEVTHSPMSDFLQRTDLNGEAAVLCRKTAPIVELAMMLIRRRVACKVEGRDIGEGLKRLAKKWRVADLDVLIEKPEEYAEREMGKAMEQKKETRAQQIEDQVETLKAIIGQCQDEGKNNIDCVERFIDDLFSDDVAGMLVLSTIHKSKGREWERVYWLDRANTCPSKWARQAWQMQQETNLMYVAATRAKSTLIELDAPIKGEKVPPAPVRQTKAKLVADVSNPVSLVRGDEKSTIEGQYAAGLIDKATRNKLHKARRARERKARA